MQYSSIMLSPKVLTISAIITVSGIIFFWIGTFRLIHYFDMIDGQILTQAIIYLAIGVAAKATGLIICLLNGNEEWHHLVKAVQTKTKTQSEQLSPNIGFGKIILGLLLYKFPMIIAPFLSLFLGMSLIFLRTLGMTATFIFLIIIFILTVAFFDMLTRKKRKRHQLANPITEKQQENQL